MLGASLPIQLSVGMWWVSLLVIVVPGAGQNLWME